MVQNKKGTLPDTPKAKPANVPDNCIAPNVCGMHGDETVYGPATVGGSNIVYDKNGKKKDDKPQAKTGDSVYIKANAPVQSSFTPMANMTRKYK